LGLFMDTLRFSIEDGPTIVVEAAIGQTSSSSSGDLEQEVEANVKTFHKLLRVADSVGGLKSQKAPVISRGGNKILSFSSASSYKQEMVYNDILILREDEVFVIPQWVGRESNQMSRSVKSNAYMETSSGKCSDSCVSDAKCAIKPVFLDWDQISADIHTLDTADADHQAEIVSLITKKKENLYVDDSFDDWTTFVLWDEDGNVDDDDDDGVVRRFDSPSDRLCRLFFAPMFEDDIRDCNDFKRLLDQTRTDSGIETVEKLEIGVVSNRDSNSTFSEQMKTMTREEKIRYQQGQKLARLRNINVGFNAAASMETMIARSMRRDFGGAMSGRSRLLGSVWHFPMAKQHRNCKPDLSIKELRNYHSPRLTKRHKMKPWNITIQTESHLIASHPDTKGKLGSRLEDVSVLTGDFICIEYSEERPPVMTNMGMGSKVVNYFRPPEDGSTGDTSSESLDEANQEQEQEETSTSLKQKQLPKHIRLLEQHRGSQEKEGAAAPLTEVGKLEVLDSTEDFEFLGQLKPGQLQMCIKNQTYRAPLFPHNTPSTDFLMVPFLIENRRREKNLYELRPIPKIYLAGQMEPLIKVSKPSNKITDDMSKIILLHILRILEQREEVGSTCLSSEVQSRFMTALNTSRHPLNENQLRKLMRTVADERGAGEWILKDSYEDYERSDDVAKDFNPETVCALESTLSADFILENLGIENLDLSRLEAWLHRMQGLWNFKQKQIHNAESMGRALSDSNERKKKINELVEILRKESLLIERKKNAGQYIFERLICAPWNTTDAFVNHKDYMELIGPADPSGCGEGYCYFKRVKQGLQTGNKNQKRAGTENDLRKVTVPQAVKFLVALGVDKKQAEKMKRWDRIFLIRDIANKQQNSGQIPEDLKKYVREDKIVLSAVDSGEGGESYKEICHNIWEKQIEALSNQAIPQDSDDDESDSEDDDIDLARMEQEANETSNKANLDMQRQVSDETAAQIRQIENDRAAFESIRRLQRNFSAGATLMDAGVRTALSESLKTWKRPAYVTKRTRRVVRSDGTESIEVKYIFDQSKSLDSNDVYRPRRRSSSVVMHRSGTCDSDVDDLEEEPIMASDVTNNPPALNFQMILSKAKRGREEDVADFEGFRGRRERGSAAAVVDMNARLPKVQFASRLDEIVMEQWRSKKAIVFRERVPKTVVAYYQKIENPICLRDVRNKIGNFEYTTVRAFMDDIELLATNAKTFNGPNHKISKDGESILKAIRADINHDKDHGLPDKLRLLEDCIKAKYVFIFPSVQFSYAFSSLLYYLCATNKILTLASSLLLVHILL